MAESEPASPGSDREWWYCLKHNRVEFGPGCPNQKRLGPYGTQDEAAHALSTVAARNKAWDAEDEDD